MKIQKMVGELSTTTILPFAAIVLIYSTSSQIIRHTCKFGRAIRLTFLETKSRILKAKNRFARFLTSLKFGHIFNTFLRIKNTKKIIIIIRVITLTPGGCLFAFYNYNCLRDEKGMTIRWICYRYSSLTGLRPCVNTVTTDTRKFKSPSWYR